MWSTAVVIECSRYSEYEYVEKKTDRGLSFFVFQEFAVHEKGD